jgi:cysteine desulfurase/selenocysteine lyase
VGDHSFKARAGHHLAPQTLSSGRNVFEELGEGFTLLAFGAAADFVSAIGLDVIHAHEAALVRLARAELGRLNSVRMFGPENAAGIVSFALEGVHPHDLGTILDEENVAIRAGHHCAQPLMEYLGVPATARASFGIYSNESDVAALVRGIERTMRIFG